MSIFSSIIVYVLESGIGQAVLKIVWNDLAAVIAAYVAKKKKEAADREAVKKLYADKNQIPAEIQIGNPNPGAPSGIPGTELRDNLPGLPK